MTISNSVSDVTYTGNGAATTWDYDFYIPSQNELIVTVFDEGDSAGTVINSSDYSVTGIGSQNGGTVTYPLSGSPLTAQQTITIQRLIPYTQPTSFSNQGAFYPETVEDALDWLEMQIQQINTQSDRYLRVAINDPPVEALPQVSARAGQMLGFDSDGNPIAAQPSNALVSSAMQPVVAAATLALARAAMGIINPVVEDVTGTVSPAAADQFKTYRQTGAVDYTLGASAGFDNGYGFYGVATVGTATITPDGTDTINGGTPGAPYVMAEGTAFSVQTAGDGDWIVLILSPKAPTVTYLLSGNGTYNTPAGAKRLEIKMKGGGGGGAGTGTTSGTTGSDGAFSQFSSVSAGGGFGGATNSSFSPGFGGAGGGPGGGSASLRISGGYGERGEARAVDTSSSGVTVVLTGGRGGGAQGAVSGSVAAPPNSGCGGAGALTSSTTGAGSGGGGEGEYVEFKIDNPGASYVYIVGDGGNGGAGGTGGNAGTAGGSGFIIVTEYYGQVP